MVFPISILMFKVPRAGKNRGLTGTITYFRILVCGVYTKLLVPYNLIFTIFALGYSFATAGFYLSDDSSDCLAIMFQFYMTGSVYFCFSSFGLGTKTAHQLFCLLKFSDSELKSSGSKQIDYFFSNVVGGYFKAMDLRFPHSIRVPQPIFSMKTISLTLKVVKFDIQTTIIINLSLLLIFYKLSRKETFKYI